MPFNPYIGKSDVKDAGGEESNTGFKNNFPFPISVIPY